MPEPDLVHAVKSGDRDAYAALWRAHYGAGIRFAKSLTYRFPADDLVSEAFLRIYESIQGGRGPTTAFRPYLYVVIRNVAISWARKPIERGLNDINEPGYDAKLDLRLVARVDSVKLAEAMQELPQSWQQALVATQMCGLTPAQIGRCMGVDANSVAALAYRARRGLKHAWVRVHFHPVAHGAEHEWIKVHVGGFAHGALTPRKLEKFRHHLQMCQPCAQAVEDAIIVASASSSTSLRSDSVAIVVAPVGTRISQGGTSHAPALATHNH